MSTIKSATLDNSASSLSDSVFRPILGVNFSVAEPLIDSHAGCVWPQDYPK
jgi:hypothetical protein